MNDNNKIFGYARVSTKNQDPSFQIDMLLKEGIKRNDIYIDYVSGVRELRPSLEKMKSKLIKGDKVVVYKLDRLGRSVKDLIKNIYDFQENGIEFKSISEGTFDTSTATGKLVLNVFCMLAEFERETIRERTKYGLKAARARGRLGGRPKVITKDNPKIIIAKKLYEDKSLSIKQICNELKISEATFYRYVNV